MPLPCDEVNDCRAALSEFKDQVAAARQAQSESQGRLDKATRKLEQIVTLLELELESAQSELVHAEEIVQLLKMRFQEGEVDPIGEEIDGAWPKGRQRASWRSTPSARASTPARTI